MIRVTWEWLGQGPALDLADTVTVVDGDEHDLIASAGDYERWARVEATFVPEDLSAALFGARAELMGLRTPVRALLGAVSAGERAPRSAVDELNGASAAAPSWPELDAGDLTLKDATPGRSIDRLLAWYARGALEVVARDAGRLRRCPAPSCGMFYLSGRRAQVWCSAQCGTRARVARHYERRAAARRRS